MERFIVAIDIYENGRFAKEKIEKFNNFNVFKQYVDNYLFNGGKIDNIAVYVDDDLVDPLDLVEGKLDDVAVEQAATEDSCSKDSIDPELDELREQEEYQESLEEMDKLAEEKVAMEEELFGDNKEPFVIIIDNDKYYFDTIDDVSNFLDDYKKAGKNLDELIVYAKLENSPFKEVVEDLDHPVEDSCIKDEDAITIDMKEAIKHFDKNGMFEQGTEFTMPFNFKDGNNNISVYLTLPYQDNFHDTSIGYTSEEDGIEWGEMNRPVRFNKIAAKDINAQVVVNGKDLKKNEFNIINLDAPEVLDLVNKSFEEHYDHFREAIDEHLIEQENKKYVLNMYYSWEPSDDNRETWNIPEEDEVDGEDLIPYIKDQFDNKESYNDAINRVYIFKLNKWHIDDSVVIDEISLVKEDVDFLKPLVKDINAAVKKIEEVALKKIAEYFWKRGEDYYY